MHILSSADFLGLRFFRVGLIFGSWHVLGGALLLGPLGLGVSWGVAGELLTHIRSAARMARLRFLSPRTRSHYHYQQHDRFHFAPPPAAISSKFALGVVSAKLQPV